MLISLYSHSSWSIQILYVQLELQVFIQIQIGRRFFRQNQFCRVPFHQFEVVSSKSLSQQENLPSLLITENRRSIVRRKSRDRLFKVAGCEVESSRSHVVRSKVVGSKLFDGREWIHKFVRSTFIIPCLHVIIRSVVFIFFNCLHHDQNLLITRYESAIMVYKNRYGSDAMKSSIIDNRFVLFIHDHKAFFIYKLLSLNPINIRKYSIIILFRLGYVNILIL